MARNKYPGYCYCCGKKVEAGYGHFERIYHRRPGTPLWRIKCVECASGRKLKEDDPGVIWARKAAEEERMKKEVRNDSERTCRSD